MSEPRDRSAEWAEAITSDADYPLYVATVDDGQERSGCLVGFVTQSSIEPVRFIVCISKANHTFTVAHRSKGMALHLLGTGQRELASLFGEKTGDDVDKFADVAWSTAVTGAPVLAECVAWTDASIIGHHDAGDHEAFLIAVVDGGEGPHGGRLMLNDVRSFEPGHPAGDR